MVFLTNVILPPLQAIHGCAVRFPDVAGSVIDMLMDFLSDSAAASSLKVIFFMREIVETNAKLRLGVLERLRDTFTTVSSSSMWN